jgi:DNA polymerase-3 subunit alpha
MAKLFPEIPEAMSNTLDIAERCSVSIKIKPMLPRLTGLGATGSTEDYLRHLAHKGLKEKYAHVTPGLEERLNFELDIICKMEFADYFIIVRDFVIKAQELGIMVGARGSVAGSLVAHVIGITNVDPIRFDLLFERFLNPERISMPDADIDFADHDRYKVIDYVIERYGRESVSQIINYIRMKPKMVVKDVARAMGIPIGDANRLSAMVSEKSLDESIASNGELKRTINGNPQYEELFRHAAVLEGLARQAGQHAGGVIIARDKVVDLAPLFKQPNTDIVMTQFDMKYVEKVGLVKMDFLGLRTLTVLQEAVRLVTAGHHTVLDVWKLPENDEKTYTLFGSGETTGVFQFESQGMQDYLRKLKPTSIDDIIAMAALYRPGPMDNIDTYIHRKHGKEKVRYPHPQLAEVLDVTYGVIIYQEQVMRIAQRMGGFTLGMADVLRKAMGKKDLGTMEEMRAKFLEGATHQKIDKKTATEVFDLMAKFAEYGFNKAHATMYGHVAYQCAYLKAHYPLEYLTATMTSNIGKEDEFLKIKNEAQRMGIVILPPDINASEENCSIEGNSIRLGLAVVKNVGQGAEALLEARKAGRFLSFFDLCKRADLRKVNKKCLESLIFAGALDCLQGTRAQLHESIDKGFDYGAGFQKDRISGQANLFDDLFSGAPAAGSAGPVVPEPPLATVPPWPYSLVLQREKELLSFYVSGHPLDRFQDEINGFTSLKLSVEEIASVKDKSPVTIGGLITTVKPYVSAKGTMAFLTIEDFSGSIELLAFSEPYEKYGALLVEDSMVLVHGTMSKRDGEDKPKIMVDRCIALSESREKLARSVHVRLNTTGLENDFIQSTLALCRNAEGPCALIVHLLTAEGNEYRVRAGTVKVSAAPESITALRAHLGKDNVWIGKTST